MGKSVGGNGKGTDTAQSFRLVYPMSKNICENCGNTYMSLKDLTRGTCPHGGGATHVPYRGGIRAEYTCRWCGRKYKSLKDMTRTSCLKHPDGRGNHRPAGN